MMTGLVVLKIVLMPSSTRLASAANSGPRWSMIGVSIARRMRSGSGVGPGICKKWRPTVREAFLDISFSLAVLERDDLSSIRHPALRYWWSMIFSENRYPLFGIMLNWWSMAPAFAGTGLFRNR